MLRNSSYISKQLSEKIYPISTDSDRRAVFFAGGCVSDLITGRKPRDYDLFFRDPEILYEKLAASFRGLFRFSIEEDHEIDKLYKIKINKLDNDTDETFRHRINSLKGSNLSIGSNSRIEKITRNGILLQNGVQVIFSFVGEPEKVLKTFDYDHCKLFWEPSFFNITGGRLYITEEAKEAILRKELVYSGQSRFVLTSILRIAKFSKRGWKLHPSSLIQFYNTLNKIDFTDPETLKEQLYGFYGSDEEIIEKVIESSIVDNKINLDIITKKLLEVF